MLDLDKLDDIIEFDYSKDESYSIRYVTDEEIRTLAARNEITLDRLLGIKDTNGKKIDDNEESKEASIITNIISAVFNSDFITSVASLAVQSWTGITSKGKPLPCTDKNKKLVFSKFGNRAMFVYRKCRSENAFIGADLEVDLKNLKPSSITN